PRPARGGPPCPARVAAQGRRRPEEARVIPIKYNIRSLLVRKTTTIATAFGIGLVVFVLASSLMLGAGVKKTLATSGRPDGAIVLRQGSDNELSSVIEASEVNRILGTTGIARDDKARPIG